MNPAVLDLAFEDIAPGDQAEHSIHVAEDLVAAFAELSGDANPLHVDAEAARARGFEDRVAHGALLVGLVSGVVGTRLPGARGILHSMDMKFRQPCYAGQRVTVVVKVLEKIESVRTLILEATVRSEGGALLAQGRLQCGVSRAANGDPDRR